MIIIAIGGIMLGIFLAVVLTPIIMIGNKTKLKEMDKKITEFESRSFNTPEEKEEVKRQLKKELIKIKAGIVGDKKATEEAGDKISVI
jgi:hypothetical protein